MSFPSCITRQCEDLTELLGVTCLPYVHSESPDAAVPRMDSAYHTALQEDASVAIDAVGRALQGQSEAIVKINESRYAFAIPILVRDSNTWFAIGRSREPANASTQKLLHAAGEAARRKYQIEDQLQAIESVEQEIKRSFEERLWIRQLNAQRAVSNATVGMHSQQSLESLKSLLQAEAVAVVMDGQEEADCFGLESYITSKSRWGIEDIRMLMRRISKPVCGDSVVLNRMEYRLPHGVVHSCAIVPIGHGEPIGYVVAINRKKRFQGNAWEIEEFASRDAELLYEAANRLASDGYHNMLLHESEQLVLGTLGAMSSAIEARDPYTHGHSERVAHVGYEIACRLALPTSECREVYLAGVLHDIGKIGIPDNVLQKPGKLDPQEFAIIQKHPEIGHKIIEELGQLKFTLPGVLNHHERWDGKGYPQKLRGEETCLMARILAVSDAFDAMTYSRVYRNAMTCERAVEILKSGAGSQWDPSAVNAILEYIQDTQVCPNNMNANRELHVVD